MGLPSIELTPEEAATWMDALCADGFTVEVDKEERSRQAPSPHMLEIPYLVRKQDAWLRVLFASRPGESRTFLVFATFQQDCSRSLYPEIAKLIARAR